MIEHFENFKSYAFRLEQLSEYAVEGEVESLQKYRETGIVPKDFIEWGNIITSAVKRNAKFIRVRIIPDPISEYYALELEAYKLNAKSGDIVLGISQKEFEDLGINQQDFWLFDDNYALLMNYSEYGEYLGFQKTTSVLKLIEIKEKLLQIAKPLL